MGIGPFFDVHYDEGLKVGYKWYDAEKKPVLFPFGFGLSYTTFAYSGLSVKAGETTTVSFTVKNSGKRPGIETAQVYASLPDSAGEPPKRLVGWTKIELGPGESKHANIGISLPGTFEEPKAPVYVDGKLLTTLKGDTIVQDFLRILEDYVASHYTSHAGHTEHTTAPV